MSNSILNVAMNGLLVGEWRKLTSGATEFQYAEKWLESVRSRPISLSLPLSHKIYRGDSVYNFFDNLLPDNEQIRSRIQQRFQTTTKSPFDLLSAIGQDCIGAIQLYQGKNRSVRQIYAEPLNDKEVENVLKNYRTLSSWYGRKRGFPNFFSRRSGKNSAALLSKSMAAPFAFHRDQPYF